MKKALFSFIISLCFIVNFASHAQTNNIETIVFVRHAEKTKIELGQLSCKGLNRALKLPKLLIGKFGKPTAIFAPNPGKEIVKDSTKSYNYIRPLATIEPTAIQLGLPVNTKYGYEEIDNLSAELLNKIYLNSTLFVSWEHLKLVDIARLIYSQLGGISKNIPDWDHSDFDSIYVLKITTDSTGKRTVVFSQDHEDLDGQSETCPDA